MKRFDQVTVTQFLKYFVLFTLCHAINIESKEYA